MSPKSRGRKRKPGARPVRRPAPGPVRERDELSAAARRLADDVYAACEPFRALTGDDTDPLEAELHAAALLGALSRTWSLADAAIGMVTAAARYPEPHVAAAVAAVQHFTPGMAHGMALRDLHSRGIRPPAWAGRLGEVTPGRAWHYRDVFGEQEIFLVSFAYDCPGGSGDEHAVVSEVDHCPDPQLTRAHVSRTVDDLRGAIEAAAGLDGRPIRLEEIDPGEAGRHLRTALAHPHRDCEDETRIWIRVLRARVQVLVGDGEAEPAAAPAPPAVGTGGGQPIDDEW